MSLLINFQLAGENLFTGLLMWTVWTSLTCAMLFPIREKHWWKNVFVSAPTEPSCTSYSNEGKNKVEKKIFSEILFGIFICFHRNREVRIFEMLTQPYKWKCATKRFSLFCSYLVTLVVLRSNVHSEVCSHCYDNINPTVDEAFYFKQNNSVFSVLYAHK